MSAIESILALQEVDCRIRKIEQELKDIPARQERERSRLDEHTREVAVGEDALKACQAELKELELEVESRQQKISKFRQQQLLIKTNREFKAMESEISAVEHEISGLEDKELVLMEKLETAQKELVAKQAALKEESAAVEADVKVWDERALTLKDELESRRVDRDRAAEGVDGEWLSQYNRIFKRRERALVPLQDGICSGCHMKQPPYIVHGTKRKDAMVMCGTCGCLLY